MCESCTNQVTAKSEKWGQEKHNSAREEKTPEQGDFRVRRSANSLSGSEWGGGRPCTQRDRDSHQSIFWPPAAPKRFSDDQFLTWFCSPYYRLAQNLLLCHKHWWSINHNWYLMHIWNICWISGKTCHGRLFQVHGDQEMLHQALIRLYDICFVTPLSPLVLWPIGFRPYVLFLEFELQLQTGQDTPRSCKFLLLRVPHLTDLFMLTYKKEIWFTWDGLILGNSGCVVQVSHSLFPNVLQIFVIVLPVYAF